MFEIQFNSECTQNKYYIHRLITVFVYCLILGLMQKYALYGRDFGKFLQVISSGSGDLRLKMM